MLFWGRTLPWGSYLPVELHSLQRAVFCMKETVFDLKEQYQNGRTEPDKERVRQAVMAWLIRRLCK